MITAMRDAPHLRSESATHVGRVRRINEDRLLDRADIGLWAVADGMGGHAHGDVAAQAVIDALAAVRPGGSGYTLLSDTEAALSTANGWIRNRNEKMGIVSGTTIVALIARDGYYACLWAGDSRAYLLRDSHLSPLTRDHSVVQELIDEGLVREADRRRHPSAHVITRAVGHLPEIHIDRCSGPILPGDVFLLCSDGLTACVDDKDLRRLLLNRNVEPTRALVDCALSHGAPDNISVVRIEFMQNE